MCAADSGDRLDSGTHSRVGAPIQMDWLLDMFSGTMVLSAAAGGVFLGMAQAYGLNIWPAVIVSAYVMSGIVCFQWAVNRYADRGLALRILMGSLYGSVPMLSVPAILLQTYYGWEPPVELIREVPWGMPAPTEDIRVRAMLEASIGPKGELDSPLNLLEGAVRRAVAAIPELTDRQKAIQMLTGAEGVKGVIPLLQQLKLGRLLPAGLLTPQPSAPPADE